MAFRDFIPGLKAKKPTAPTTAKSNLIVGDNEGFSGNPGTSRMADFEDYLRAATIPNVYAAASVVAYAAANLPMDILDENDSLVDLPAVAPDLDQLLKQPNQMSNNFHFRESMIYDLLLTGNCIVAKDEYFLDKPTALYRLRPDRVRIVFGSNANDVTYTLLNSNSTAASVAATYNVDEIMHWRMANPIDPVWGMGIVEAAEVTFSTNRALNETIRAYFERGAILDGVIILPQEELSDVEYNRMINRWRSMRQRGRAQLKTGVLTGGAKYQATQEPLGQMPVVQLKEMARNEVLELFGVPPPKLGDFRGANWRNAQEADAFFYAETVGPLVRRTEQDWTKLVQMWNPNWRVAFRLPDLASDFGSRAEAVMKMSQADAFRRNEIREKGGVPALDPSDPRGNEIVNTSSAARGAIPAVGGEVDPTPTKAQGPGEAAALTPASSLSQGDSSNK